MAEPLGTAQDHTGGFGRTARQGGAVGLILRGLPESTDRGLDRKCAGEGTRRAALLSPRPWAKWTTQHLGIISSS